MDLLPVLKVCWSGFVLLFIIIINIFSVYIVAFSVDFTESGSGIPEPGEYLNVLFVFTLQGFKTTTNKQTFIVKNIVKFVNISKFTLLTFYGNLAT